jgi:alkanesulfonate monooxygenase SsuD/methylene tetrahydromethanopterin reductase-like flavin-dependent oxidoreductase (luciferase family)
VDDDARRAQQRTGDALNDLYGYFGLKGIERVAVAGRPDDVAGQLADIAAAGAGLILLNPLFDEAEQMEWLSAEVIPQLA